MIDYLAAEQIAADYAAWEIDIGEWEERNAWKDGVFESVDCGDYPWDPPLKLTDGCDFETGWAMRRGDVVGAPDNTYQVAGYLAYVILRE